LLTRCIVDDSLAMLRAADGAFGAAARSLQSPPPAPHAFRAPAADFSLQELSPERFASIAGMLRHPFVWVNDDNCLRRAVLGAAIAQRAATGAMVASGDEGLYAAVASAELVATSQDDWWRHVFMIMQRAGAPEPYAVDYVLFKKPVPLSRMAGALEIDPSAITVRSPFGFDYGDGAYDPGKALLERWSSRHHLPGSVVSGDLQLPVRDHRTLAMHRREAAEQLEREIELSRA